MGLRLLIIAGLGVLLIGGCGQRLNDRITLGGGFVSPSLMSGNEQTTRTEDPALFSRTVADRSQWTPIAFVAHFDGVVHERSLIISPPRRARAKARAFGRFPTQRDAIKLQSRSWIDDLLETGREIGRSFIGTPYAVGYLIVIGEHDTPGVSPRPYKRTRQDDWSSGVPAKPEQEQDTDD